jgi:hypothetical protein
MIPARLAPRMLRTAISLRRASDRDSSRLAKFAHAISRTNPTAANSTSTAARTLATMSSCTGSKLMLCDGSASEEFR